MGHPEIVVSLTGEVELISSSGRPVDGRLRESGLAPVLGSQPPALEFDPATLQWDDAFPGNRDGVARALTVIGPLRRVWKLRFWFWARRHSATFRGVKAEPLRKLAFLHFARWVLIDTLPRADGVSHTRLRPVHLYFEANFNDAFEPYIDAFSYVIPHAMKQIFGGAYGFPGPKPATNFKAYIRRHEFKAAHYYSAYPCHTSSQIVDALAVRARVVDLAAVAQRLSPEAFARAWNDLLAGRPRMVPIKLSRQKDPNVAMGGQAYALTVITAIRPGREDEVDEALEALSQSHVRPFARSPTTHFARLVVIEHLPSEGSPLGLPTLAYRHLLFSAVIDGSPHAYLQALCTQMPSVVDAVWGNCLGGPEHPSAMPEWFAQWMWGNRLNVSSFFAPYSVASLAEVREALAFAERVRDLATRAQYRTPREVREAFMRMFPAPETASQWR